MQDVLARMAGGRARVSLLTPHVRRLENAAEVLDNIAVVPCDEQEECKQLADQLRAIGEKLKKRPLSKDCEGQQELPLGGGDGSPDAEEKDEGATSP